MKKKPKRGKKEVVTLMDVSPDAQVMYQIEDFNNLERNLDAVVMVHPITSICYTEEQFQTAISV